MTLPREGASRDGCPSPDELRRFRDDELGDDARRLIVAHVNCCTNCQEWLDDDRSPGLAHELLAAKVVFPRTEGAGPPAEAGIASVTDPDSTALLSPRPVGRTGALQPLLAHDSVGTRSKGVKARGSGEPAANLATWLRRRPRVDVVILEAFSVEPATGP